MHLHVHQCGRSTPVCARTHQRISANDRIHRAHVRALDSHIVICAISAVQSSQWHPSILDFVLGYCRRPGCFRILAFDFALAILTPYLVCVKLAISRTMLWLVLGLVQNAFHCFECVRYCCNICNSAWFMRIEGALDESSEALVLRYE